MKLTEYQKQANRTCPDLGSLELNLCHMVLGLCSEEEEHLKAIVEFDQINRSEEIFDKFWYLSNYCTFRDLNLNLLFEKHNEVYLEVWEEKCDVYAVHVSKLTDYVKKYMAYGKEIDRYKEENSLKVIIRELYIEIDEQNIDFEQGLENNINKLKVRFPDKFTKKNALNRDLESERKELEK